MEHMKPRRLRLVGRGMHNYNGDIGGIAFEEGVSVHPVGWLDAQRIGSVMLVEDADIPGYQVNPAAEMQRIRGTPATDPQVQAVGKAVVVNGEITQIASRYTLAELEVIADEKGLQGLRDIGAQWGIGARSIRDLINRILSAQAVADSGRVVQPDGIPVGEIETGV